MNPFDKILIKTPKTSRFDQRNTNKLSMRAGKLVPIWWKDITPNEQVRLKLSSLVKTAPMVAPIYDRLKLETFAFFVPYRLLGWDSEKFFNLSTPIADRPSMPQVLGYFGPRAAWINQSPHYDVRKQSGELMDYLGYPLYLNYVTHYVDAILSQNVNVFQFSQTPLDQANMLLGLKTKSVNDPTYEVNYDFSVEPEPVNNQVIWSFYAWLAISYLANNLGLSLRDILVNGFGEYGITVDFLNDHIADIGFSNESEAYEAYKIYVFDAFLNMYVPSGSFNPDFSNLFANTADGATLRDSLRRSSLPKRSYWRIIADWFVNSNFVDVEDLLSKYVYSDYTSDVTPYAYFCANRYWENDYFTSAFASTQSGQDVPIPVNGNIRDLRNASKLQKVMELVLYNGKRYIDQIFGMFGARSSDTRLDRCEVLGKSDFVFGVEEITQQSASDSENPLGSFAGRAITAGSDGMFNYHAEEHGMIMILACIKPLASYIGVQDRLLFKTSPYDFLIPQFAQVGEQPIFSDELQQQLPSVVSDIGVVFGYQRRYAEYMFKHNEVHADFSTSMDYWTMARKFDTIPTLNSDFLQITDSDNLNRAFAVPSSRNHFYCYFSFEFNDVNSLPRYLNYDL